MYNPKYFSMILALQGIYFHWLRLSLVPTKNRDQTKINKKIDTEGSEGHEVLNSVRDLSSV